ncbi:hypothetical protein TNCV_1188651 [Trichonephila clavipes]|nr:hypothetical protein TNCV_1188651 [Trichonephila clavipes]
MGRLSGIRLWEYNRENLENKSKQEVIMEESSKEGTEPRGAVLPDMMPMNNHRTQCVDDFDMRVNSLPSGREVAYRSSTPQARGSILGLAITTQSFIPSVGR